MQITLNHDEIVTAIEDYVHHQITIGEDQEVVVDLKAGRGENGFSAQLDIMAAVQPETRKPILPRTKTETIQIAETPDRARHIAETGLTGRIIPAPIGVVAPQQTPIASPATKVSSFFGNATAVDDADVDATDKGTDESPPTAADKSPVEAGATTDGPDDSEELAEGPALKKTSIFNFGPRVAAE